MHGVGHPIGTIALVLSVPSRDAQTSEVAHCFVLSHRLSFAYAESMYATGRNAWHAFEANGEMHVHVHQVVVHPPIGKVKCQMVFGTPCTVT